MGISGLNLRRLSHNDNSLIFALEGNREEKILVINCGSSSLKYCFYNTANEDLNIRGLIEKIGITGTRLTQEGPNGKVKLELKKNDFKSAMSAMLDALLHKEHGVIKTSTEISLVVHRVVHGGNKFTETTLITDKVIKDLEELSSLAPLHNPINIAGINEMQGFCPTARHVAVFDTAFHNTLPAFAFLYGLPYEMYTDKHIRRYGFHGTSHQYVSLRAAEYLGRHSRELRIISCHLGNGSSLCAINSGKSIDTSMGFTPAEGLIMGTRCGDIDSGVLAYLERTSGFSANQSEELLNKKSGLLGMSGISSDMREILKAANEGNEQAILTLNVYCYRVKKYIGAYFAALGGADTIVFTAGIGQGSAEVRELSLQGLAFMGIKLDKEKNRAATDISEIKKISADDSRTSVLVIPTDEERMMAREALILTKGHKEQI